MSVKKTVRKLDTIYRGIPTGFCKGLCHDSCGPVAMSLFEMARMRRAAPPKFDPKDHISCPFLDHETKKCRGYDVRPAICRIWGATKSLACPHGCTDTIKPLTDLMARRIIDESLRIGGESIETHPGAVRDVLFQAVRL